MQRRTFFRTGLAAGALSLGRGSLAPTDAWGARPTRANGPIRLSSNENPLGLAPVARRAVMDGLSDANRYPGESRRALLEAIAAKHAVEVDHIVLGTGSSEVLQMAVQSFGQHRARFIIAEPTFEDVPRYAEPWELRLEAVPLRADRAHDVDRMQEIAGRSGEPVVVYLCNPNNPTGTMTPSVEIDAWIESAPDNVKFLVDEAYYEYAEQAPGYWSAMKWIESHPNVMVVRTFSKIYGMAGMRLGYGISHPETAERLRSLQSHNNANHLANVAALASLGDPGLVGRSLEVNKKAKRVTHEVLDELGLEYLPSYTNFLMHRIKGDLEQYNTRMRDHGLRVGRPFPPMLEYSRVSFGTPEEMETFAEVLRGFREWGWI